jgi:regulator of sigma D
VAAQLYPRINVTTQHCLDFNDKYDNAEATHLGHAFHDDLSRLGEEIATRIELEDKLLAVMR